MKKKQTSWHTRIFYMITLSITPLHAYDNAHFYRATRLCAEPRFEKPWLSSFDIDCGAGTTTTGLNSCGEKVNILEIYGPYNMHQLGVNIPTIDLTHPADQTLTDLSALLAPGNFGIIGYSGKFNIVELNATYTQNFIRNFFIQLHTPIRMLNIHRVLKTDQTTQSGTFNNNTPEWLTFLDSFHRTLTHYNLWDGETNGTHVGDTTLLFGWTINYQNTEAIDFVDATLKGGVLFPTGKARNENEIFSLPWGYNKHWGIPISADISLGCYSWLTIGAHVDLIPFFKRTQTIRMKTAFAQSGLLKLAQGCATVHRGTQWIAGTYIKADHLAHRFSLIIGYSCAGKQNDRITPANQTAFNYAIVNSDEAFHGWYMHTIHLSAEYDFTKENYLFGPRLSLFANIPISGRRIFKTSVTGLSFGLEIAL